MKDDVRTSHLLWIIAALLLGHLIFFCTLLTFALRSHAAPSFNFPILPKSGTYFPAPAAPSGEKDLRFIATRSASPAGQEANWRPAPLNPSAGFLMFGEPGGCPSRFHFIREVCSAKQYGELTPTLPADGELFALHV